ncbi:ABC transporter substrate-binding protein [Leucobacter weissii]|uniref:ABC transporter substrate-binding protein n=1 Tax=Leucobacter weissii TaxID=1983706 RepID=A0A939MH37_9MICO|nr:ABC transporter substrate-binding protein [Leucobacter weissii]MBO1900511.1 ABC transporter substrate-binding protein [Leucobacter weissii]
MPRPTRIQRRGPASIATAAALAAALLASGCAPQTGGGAPSDGDTEQLTVALPGSLENLYPGQEAGILNYYVAAIAAEGLVSVDATGNLQPGLAESWEQPDPQTYVYRIRDDAKFQDGTPVTVDDILVSIEKSQDAEVSPQFATWYGNLESAEETGENEITIRLAEPDVGFTWIPSASAGLFVAPAAYWEEHGDDIGTGEGLLLGTGPYQASEFVPDSHITFTGVDTWWGGEAEYESIRFEIIPDENTRLLAQQSGDLDLSFNVPLQQSAQWEGSENIEVAYTPDRSYVGLTFDTSLAPFDDVHVRNAVAHSFDGASVVEKVLNGHGEVATALLTPSQLETAFSPEEARQRLGELPGYAFDLDTAGAELAASEHADGFETELTYPNTLPELGLAAQSLAQNLEEIGISVTVTELPISQWFETLGDGEHGLSFMSYSSTTGDPAELTSWFLGPENLAKYENPEVTDALTAARSELDETKRLELLIEANRLQAADNAYFPLWWGERATAFSNGVSLPDYGTFSFVSPWPAKLQRSAG